MIASNLQPFVERAVEHESNEQTTVFIDVEDDCEVY